MGTTDIEVRWSSLLSLLQRWVELAEPCRLLDTQADLPIFNNRDIKNAKALISILELVVTCLKGLQFANAHCGCAIVGICDLVGKLRTSEVGFKILRQTLADNIELRFARLSNDEMFKLGVFLDPRLRAYSSLTIEEAYSIMKSLKLTNDEPTATPTPTPPTTPSANSKPSGLAISRKFSAAPELSPILSELSVYNNIALSFKVADDAYEIFSKVDQCYSFWRKSSLSLLKKICLFPFSIPSSCAELERVYSHAGCFDSPHRRSMAADSLRRLTLLNRNFAYSTSCKYSPFDWIDSIDQSNNTELIDPF